MHPTPDPAPSAQGDTAGDTGASAPGGEAAKSHAGSRVHSWVQPWVRPWLYRGWRTLLVELGLLIVGIWAAANLVYLTAYGASVPNHDVREYRHYALQFWTVPPLFHHLPVEYPPLSIVVFTLSLIPATADPLVVFIFWMAVLFLAGYLWFLRHADSRRARTYAVYLLVGAASTVFARFDLVPALLTLLALFAAERRRFRLAYVLVAIGILLKLYPAFLVPVVALGQWRALQHDRQPRTDASWAIRDASTPNTISGLAPRLRAWLIHVDGVSAREAALGVARGVGLCALIVLLGFGLAALLSPADALSDFHYAGARPLQIESTPASILWLGTWVGLPAHAVYTYQSLNLVGPLDRFLEPFSAVALIGGCLVVYWEQWRGRLDLGRAFVACLCVVLVTNKIFSPQYLIWVLPLAAYVVGFDALWLVVGILTTLIYPFLYFAHGHILLVAKDWRFLPIVALRNGLLVLVTLRLMGLRVWHPLVGWRPARGARTATHEPTDEEMEAPSGQVPARVLPM